MELAYEVDLQKLIYIFFKKVLPHALKFDPNDYIFKAMILTKLLCTMA